MAQYKNISSAITASLTTGQSTIYAVVNNSGSSVVKLYDGLVNPLAPLNGLFTSSIGATTGSASSIATIAFTGVPVKVDYGVRTRYGLIVVASTGDVTVIFE
jgi:hypothetical protein